jgi:hypothetical protein
MIYGTMMAYRNLVFNSCTMVIMCLYYISHEFMSRLVCRKRPTIVKCTSIILPPSAARRTYICRFTAPSSALIVLHVVEYDKLVYHPRSVSARERAISSTILDGPHDANYYMPRQYNRPVFAWLRSVVVSFVSHVICSSGNCC